MFWIVGAGLIVVLWLAKTNAPGIFTVILVFSIIFVALCLLVASGNIQGRARRLILRIRRLDIGSGSKAHILQQASSNKESQRQQENHSDIRSSLYRKLDRMSFWRMISRHIVGQPQIEPLVHDIRTHLGTPNPKKSLNVLIYGEGKTGKSRLAEIISEYLTDLAGSDDVLANIEMSRWNDGQAQDELARLSRQPFFLVITNNLERLGGDVAAHSLAEVLQRSDLAQGIFLFTCRSSNAPDEKEQELATARLVSQLGNDLLDAFSVRYPMKVLDDRGKVRAIFKFADQMAKDEFGIALSVPDSWEQNEAISEFAAEAVECWQNAGQEEFSAVSSFVKKALSTQLADAANSHEKPKAVEPVGWAHGTLKLMPVGKSDKRLNDTGKRW